MRERQRNSYLSTFSDFSEQLSAPIFFLIVRKFKGKEYGKI